MVKVTIGGEVFSFDNERYPLTEAIALEEGLGMTYGEWQAALQRGSAKALAGFVWLVLKRDGRDTPLADVLSGVFEVNEGDVRVEAEGGPDPTVPPPSSAVTGGNGSASSPTSSATPRRKPTRSPSTSSTT